MKLGTENKKKTVWAAALGAVAVLVAAYEFSSMMSGPTSTSLASAPLPVATNTRGARGGSRGDRRLAAVVDTLDPTLQLQLLDASEQTKYEGKGKNIFVAQQEEVKIEIPKSSGAAVVEPPKWVPPPLPPQPPIPLKFFGFASKPGEPKRIFLSKGDSDVFIAGEGEIVDRRYKVMRISPTAVEVQDLVNSGPPQSIPLTQNL